MTQIDKNKRKGVRPVLSVIIVEGGVVLLLTLLCWPFFNGQTTLSVLLGGTIFVIPNTYFTLYAFRYRGAEWSDLIARSFLQGQMGKLALSAAAFALAFHFIPALNAMALFGSYIVLVFVHIVVAGFISSGLDHALVNNSTKTERKF